jgi:hypothetical protein
MPTEVSHECRQPLARAGATPTLRHLQEIEERLRTQSLDEVIADLPANAFEPQPPCVGVACAYFLTPLL